MPLYEYECEDCEHRFEKIQKFSDRLVSNCPKCGGKVNKLVSSPAIQFKGTGWYVTDYAKKPSGDPAEGASDGASSKSEKSGTSESSSTSTKTDSSSSTKTNMASSSSSSATK